MIGNDLFQPTNSDSSMIYHRHAVKINFLAIDFDQTMIDIHTGGRWKGTTPELNEHMRPLFLHFVPLASQNNIRVAIVRV
jgi:hypothetical protein